MNKIIANSIILKRLSQIANQPAVMCLRKVLDGDANLSLVGGSVRDVATAADIVDLDLACSFTPEKVKTLLKQHEIRTIDTGINHGTVTAIVDGNAIEITTFRTKDSAGNIGFGKDLVTDLSLRDFTINALAFHLDSETLVDPFNGLEDLKSGVVQCVGKAHQRFIEDPLRIMRMLRLGPAMNRTIEEQTQKAAKQLAENLLRISVERIRTELERILLEAYPDQALRQMKTLGIMPYVLPELLPCVGFEQNQFHHQDVFEHTLTVLKRTTVRLPVRLAALFHDSGKPDSLSEGPNGARHFYEHEVGGAKICSNAMRRLRFSNSLITKVTQLVRLHMRPLDCGPAGVRRLLNELGNNFNDWLLLKIADKPPAMPEAEFEQQLAQFDKIVQTEQERCSEPGYGKLNINGDDLLEIGFSSGPALGAALKTLEQIVINNPDLNDKGYLIDQAKSLLVD